MNEDEIRGAFLEALHRVAPDVDPTSLDSSADLREAADLDSVDILNLVTRLHATLGVDVPETDYEELVTVDGGVRYLKERVGTQEA